MEYVEEGEEEVEYVEEEVLVDEDGNEIVHDGEEEVEYVEEEASVQDQE